MAFWNLHFMLVPPTCECMIWDKMKRGFIRCLTVMKEFLSLVKDRQITRREKWRFLDVKVHPLRRITELTSSGCPGPCFILGLSTWLTGYKSPHSLLHPCRERTSNPCLDSRCFTVCRKVNALSRWV